MEPTVLRLRRPSNGSGVLLGKPDLEAAIESHAGGRLLCRACGEPITAESQRIAVEGQSVHRRTNPAGIEFEFGCFAGAPGVLVVGQPTPEFSWFAGYSWSYAMCRGCREHLGWFFRGLDSSFHALILERLLSEDTDDTSGSPRS